MEDYSSILMEIKQMLKEISTRQEELLDNIREVRTEQRKLHEEIRLSNFVLHNISIRSEILN